MILNLLIEHTFVPLAGDTFRRYLQTGRKHERASQLGKKARIWAKYRGVLLQISIVLPESLCLILFS